MAGTAQSGTREGRLRGVVGLVRGGCGSNEVTELSPASHFHSTTEPHRQEVVRLLSLPSQPRPLTSRNDKNGVFLDSFLSLFFLKLLQAYLDRSGSLRMSQFKDSFVHSRPCLCRREAALGKFKFWPLPMGVSALHPRPTQHMDSFKDPARGAMGTRMLTLVRYADDVPERRDWA